MRFVPPDWRSLRARASALPIHLLALFFVVVGVRLWMVSLYSSDLPIRDQWDYEGAAVLKPSSEGHLTLSDLLRPHNEHRLVLARVMAVVLVGLNRQWDSLLEIVVTNLFCGFAAVAVASVLASLSGSRYRFLTATVVALWWTLPYGQENTLLALGASYYFVLVFSLIGMWGLLLHSAFSKRWWIGALAVVLACLEMGSGVFAAAVVLGVIGLRALKRAVDWRAAGPTIVFCVAVGLLSAAFRVTVPHHHQLQATSFSEWAIVFARCLAWPFCDLPPLAALMYAPAVALSMCYLRWPRGAATEAKRHHIELLMAGAVWAALQAAAIAYTRAGSGISLPVSRYMDILACGAVANFLAALVLMRESARKRRLHIALFVATALWATGVIAGAAALSYRELPPLEHPRAILRPQEESVRAYVATGDRSYLERAPSTRPYPDVTRLASLLDDPAIRRILPSSVRAPLPLDIPPDQSAGFVLNGVPAGVVNPPYEHAWGSYSPAGDSGAARLETEKLATSLPYLEFEITGRLATRMSLRLFGDGNREQTRFRSERLIDPDWRAGVVRVPASGGRIVARDENSAAWFAFREPREMGRLSVWATEAMKRGQFLAFIGGVLWVALAIWGLVHRVDTFIQERLQPPENTNAQSNTRPADRDKTKRGAVGSHPRSAVLNWLLLAASLLPIAVALWVQVKYWVNIPVWDEWDTPGIAIVRWFQHNLRWADLVAQHNESRKVLPRLVGILLAAGGRWDVRHAMVLTFASYCAVSYFVWRFLRRSVPSQRVALGAVAVVNLLLFAPSQYENLLSSYMYEFMVPVLGLFAAATTNLSRLSYAKKTLFCTIVALASTYTFAHGLLLCLLASPIPAGRDFKDRRTTARTLLLFALFCAAGLLSVLYYFSGYVRPAAVPEPARLSQAFEVLRFFVTWLGFVLQPLGVQPEVIGATVLLLLVISLSLAALSVTRDGQACRKFYPWFLLAAFATGGGLLTAVGRVNIGIGNVFATTFHGFSGVRFNATAVFVYVATIGLCLTHVSNVAVGQRARTLGYGVIGAACAALLLAWGVMFKNERWRVEQLRYTRENGRWAVAWAREMPDNPVLVAAYPYLPGFAARVVEMQKMGLLKLPRVTLGLAQKVSRPPVPSGPPAGYLDVARLNGNSLQITGWAQDPSHGRPLDLVVVGWREGDTSFHPIATVAVGSLRPDVASVTGNRALLRAGFEQTLDASQLPNGPVIISGWGVDMKQKRVFALSGSISVDRSKI